MTTFDDRLNRVERCLKKLTRLNRAARVVRTEESRQAYLKRVYRYAREFARSSKQGDYRKILKMAKHDDKTVLVPAAAFIDVLLRMSAGNDDRRLRNKHATALKFAATLGDRSAEVMTRLRQYGGYNGAASSYRFLLKQYRE